jgi:hypothetical protein
MIYLDESGFARDTPRTHGYSKKGERCYGSHDWNANGRTNAIGAIVGLTFLTLSLFDAMINTDVFYAWLTQDLLPKVPKGAIMVMDNATFHKRHDMIQAVRDRECTLECLPPYSPDLNPIEKKWAQAKAIRKSHQCSVDALFSIHYKYAEL